MGAVELQQTLQVHIGDAIAIGHQECLAADQRRQSFDAPSRDRVQPRINQMDRPFLVHVLLANDLPGSDIDGEVGAVQV